MSSSSMQTQAADFELRLSHVMGIETKYALKLNGPGPLYKVLEFKQRSRHTTWLTSWHPELINYLYRAGVLSEVSSKSYKTWQQRVDPYSSTLPKTPQLAGSILETKDGEPIDTEVLYNQLAAKHLYAIVKPMMFGQPQVELEVDKRLVLIATQQPEPKELGAHAALATYKIRTIA